jgi:hypothetical protein
MFNLSDFSAVWTGSPINISQSVVLSRADELMNVADDLFA